MHPEFLAEGILATKLFDVFVASSPTFRRGNPASVAEQYMDCRNKIWNVKNSDLALGCLIVSQSNGILSARCAPSVAEGIQFSESGFALLGASCCVMYT
jgi:hypothetical protein